MKRIQRDPAKVEAILFWQFPCSSEIYFLSLVTPLNSFYPEMGGITFKFILTANKIFFFSSKEHSLFSPFSILQILPTHLLYRLRLWFYLHFADRSFQLKRTKILKQRSLGKISYWDLNQLKEFGILKDFWQGRIVPHQMGTTFLFF